ncbi:hypothetical protein AAHC03_05421 [Spirometra sp. Aus1]
MLHSKNCCSLNTYKVNANNLLRSTRGDLEIIPPGGDSGDASGPTTSPQAQPPCFDLMPDNLANVPVTITATSGRVTEKQKKLKNFSRLERTLTKGGRLSCVKSAGKYTCYSCLFLLP